MDNITMLYELSLNVGSSLDLEDNCRTFLEAMMSRCNFGFVALYLCRPTPGAQSEFRSIFATPQCLGPTPQLRAAHPGIREVVAKGAISQPLRDSGFPEVVAVAPVSPSRDGILTAFALDEMGVLFCIDQTRDAAIAPSGLRPFRLLLEKFRHSVSACLDHERLAAETATRIELQKRVAQMERMESLGLLAGGVAHDLKNILTPIALLPDAIRWELNLPAESSVHEELSAIENAALQAADVISDLLAMARSGGGRSEVVHLTGSVDAFLKSAAFRRVSGQYPQVETEVQLSETAGVRASNSAMGRIQLNLVVNAFEAMAGTGKVHIRTRELVLAEEFVGYESIPPGRYCLLEVGDTGSGIPEDVLSRVFEPFFSSKEVGCSGSGLGLAVVYGLVKDFGGYVDISTGSEGTCFRLYFSAMAAQGSASSPHPGSIGEI